MLVMRPCCPILCSRSNVWGWPRNQIIRAKPAGRGTRILAMSNSIPRKRTVVEHICLLKADPELSPEREQDMLDYLYTCQYHVRGVLAVSLGRVSNPNAENYTHALFMRFQSKQDLARYYESPSCLQALEQHVMPYCSGLTDVDYESQVQDDILPIFRKGEEFNHGLEFVLLVTSLESALDGLMEDALSSLEDLVAECPPLTVQCTKGSNFNQSSRRYTHGVVIRFRSSEAFQMFMNSSKYKDVWRSKIQPLTKGTLEIHIPIDPVGTEIM